MYFLVWMRSPYQIFYTKTSGRENTLFSQPLVLFQPIKIFRRILAILHILKLTP